MRPLLTREEAREHDRDAIERLGVPGLVLMENAARGAFEFLCERYRDRLARVVIVGGPGQNGGDGWAVGRHLVNLGRTPQVVLVGSREAVRGDADINLRALSALGLAVHATEDGLEELARRLADATLVIDGLFGTGLSRPVEGVYARAVEYMNAARAPVLSLDLPSGIDANVGAILGCAVRADATVTFAGIKRGLCQYPGRLHAGQVVTASIGVPPPSEAEALLFDDSDLVTTLAQRAPDAHKGVAGRLLIVAGGPGKTGAALLSGQGALHAGAGLVTVATRGDARDALDGRIPELMTDVLPESPAAAAEQLRDWARRVDAMVLGPGFGTDAPAAELLRELALTLPVPTVLDADALTALGSDLGPLCQAPAARVLTPHPGEAARLLGSTSAAVQADRHAAAAALSDACGQVVVLKGAGTVVARGARHWVTTAGTPAMGIAGMGDVLSGVIGALLPTWGAEQAAIAGVHWHARAGEHAAQADRGLLASQLAHALPAVLQACRNELA